MNYSSLLIAFSVVAAQGQPAEPLAVSICDVLAAPERYHEALVTVTGRIVVTMESTFLDGAHCTSTPDTMGLYKGASLSMSSEPTDPAEAASMRNASALLKLIEADPLSRRPVKGLDRLYGSFVGRVRTAVLKVREGKWRGFGHLSGYRLELQVASVSSVTFYFTPQREEK